MNQSCSWNNFTSFRSFMSESGVLRSRHTAPRFATPIWNVYARQFRVTQESPGIMVWVGNPNPSVWTVISCLQKDCAIVEPEELKHQYGEVSHKWVKQLWISKDSKLCVNNSSTRRKPFLSFFVLLVTVSA